VGASGCEKDPLQRLQDCASSGFVVWQTGQIGIDHHARCEYARREEAFACTDLGTCLNCSAFEVTKPGSTITGRRRTG
jgi:hypothetical protein